jgi:HD-like signal output (HDOD) protein/DNA-binding response OmpR family regulator
MSTRHVVAIFLENTALAHEVGRLVESEGAEVKIVSQCDELYQLANFNRLDALVIQQEMRTFLNGLEMVTRLFQDLLRPSIVFIADARGECIAKAEQLSVEVILRHDSMPTEIAAGVHRCLAKSEHPNVFVSPAARRIVQQCDNIPPLPQVVLQLAQHAQKDDVSPSEVAKEISSDPRLTAELLRIINSSAMGFSRRIVKVFDAVTLLGVKRTASLLLSSRVLESHKAFTQAIPDTDRLWFNRRSIVTAASASIFAERFAGLSADTAYILGLLQDLGILVMMKTHGQNYIHLVRRFRKIGQFRFDAVERQDFGVTHAEVSTALLVKWGFPQSVTAAIAKHHDLTPISSVPVSKFCPVLQIGEAVANLMDGHVAHRLPILMRNVAKLGNVATADVKQAIADSIGQAAKQAKIFSIPVPADGALESVVKGVSREEEFVTANGDAEFSVADDDNPDDVLTNPEVMTSDDTSPRTMRVNHTIPRPRRVLVLEGDKTMADLIRRMLEKKGVAIEESIDRPADVVVCDGNVGSVDGVSLINQLRQDGMRAPIILLSEDRSAEGVRRSIAAGASDYLVKPIDLQYLSQRLDFWLHAAS